MITTLYALTTIVMSNTNDRPDGPPVFALTHHPELKTLGRKAIHNFLRERERYLPLVAEARSQGSAYQAISLVAAVKFELLKALVSLRSFDGVTDVTHLTEKKLQKWLEEKGERAIETFSLDGLDAVIKKRLVMKSKEPDPTMRVINVFAD